MIFPSNFLKILYIIILISSVIGFLPQIIKNYKDKKGVELSKILMLNLVINSSSWTLYGFLKDDLFLLLESLVVFIFQILFCIQNYYYLHQEKKLNLK